MQYIWRPATGTDVSAIVTMAEQHFQNEIDTIFTPSPMAYSRNITFAVVRQFYAPNDELVSVAVNEQNQLLAYTWAVSNERAPWSDDRMVLAKMAHLDHRLSLRLRVQLVKDMLMLWEGWAETIGVPIICSTTMRHDQLGFLKLHQRQGYDVRGSTAYKRISLLK